MLAGNSCGCAIACSYYSYTASAINQSGPEATTNEIRPCECKQIPRASKEGRTLLGTAEAAFKFQPAVQHALRVLCTGTGTPCSVNKFLHKELSRNRTMTY